MLLNPTLHPPREKMHNPALKKFRAQSKERDRRWRLPGKEKETKQLCRYSETSTKNDTTCKDERVAKRKKGTHHGRALWGEGKWGAQWLNSMKKRGPGLLSVRLRYNGSCQVREFADRKCVFWVWEKRQIVAGSHSQRSRGSGQRSQGKGE